VGEPAAQVIGAFDSGAANDVGQGVILLAAHFDGPAQGRETTPMAGGSMSDGRVNVPGVRPIR
jgi:hypothetical protein